MTERVSISSRLGTRLDAQNKAAYPPTAEPMTAMTFYNVESLVIKTEQFASGMDCFQLFLRASYSLVAIDTPWHSSDLSALLPLARVAVPLSHNK
jgi:hypothetical protein